MSIKILFVCFGNTCRSPMASAIFRDLAAKLNVEWKFEVDSAGISEKIEVVNYSQYHSLII